MRRVFAPYDRLALAFLMLLAAGSLGARWLERHPEHNPWAPLEIDHPAGWATARKLAALRDDPPACRAVLARGEIDHTVLPAAGSGQCLRADRTVLGAAPTRGLVLAPARAEATCAVGAGLAIWLRQAVQPAAKRLFDSRVARLEHYGTNSCRRIGGGSDGRWSEHATGNAIDIAAFVLADGTRISVLRDWKGEGPKARFLREAHAGGCPVFATVLGPDYNAAHADHLHLDQAGRGRGWTFCR
jgi:hypothetical protein